MMVPIIAGELVITKAFAAAFFATSFDDYVADDVEKVIRRARHKASSQGASVEVLDLETRKEIARVWPDGQVDVTMFGSRYA
jgi:hypothetical protein